MNDLLTNIYAHNRWANLALLDACKDLTEQQLEAGAEGTYGTLRDTLHHLVSAESRYVWRMQGSVPPAPPGENGGFPGFDELRKQAEVSGDALIGLAISVPGETSYTTTFDGTEYNFVANLVKVQAINHATEHRAQVATILTQLGIEPPEMDGWTFGFSSGLMTKKEPAQSPADSS